MFPRILRHSQRFRDLYRKRVVVERAFGDLKNHYGLAPLRVRGLERVQLHADLVMLARLTQALTRARGSARCVAVSLLVFPQKSNDLVKSLKELVVRKICWDLGRRMKDSDPGPVKCPVGLRKRVFDVG
jgi:hypothetical protein